MSLSLDLLNTVAEANPLEVQTIPVVAGRRLHVDGDMIAYMAGGNDSTSVAASRSMMFGKLNSFINAAGPESIVMQLTSEGCLKGNRPLYSVTRPYQDHRKGGSNSKPKNWQYMRDYMAQYTGDMFTPFIWADREADDGLGLASNNPANIIASGDKDMLMLPGWHVDWVTYEMTHVPPGTFYMEHRDPDKCFGYKWFLMQLLHGDSADAIPGMGSGYGTAYAKEVLIGITTAEEGCQAVMAEYMQAFPDTWASRLSEMAVLLWIRRGREANANEWLGHWASPHPALTRAQEHHDKRVEAMLAEAAALYASPIVEGQQTWL